MTSAGCAWAATLVQVCPDKIIGVFNNLWNRRLKTSTHFGEGKQIVNFNRRKFRGFILSS